MQKFCSDRLSVQLIFFTRLSVQTIFLRTFSILFLKSGHRIHCIFHKEIPKDDVCTELEEREAHKCPVEFSAKFSPESDDSDVSPYKTDLAVRSIYDRKALFVKGSRKSKEFKHLNGFFSYFL